MASSLRLLVVLAPLLLAGCVTTPKDPNLVTDHRWIGGAISLEARRTSESTFDITAKGAAHCKAEQVMQAWIYLADKVANGRSYEKTTKTESYDYSAPAGFGYTYHTGLKVTGTISLK